MVDCEGYWWECGLWIDCLQVVKYLYQVLFDCWQFCQVVVVLCIYFGLVGNGFGYVFGCDLVCFCQFIQVWIVFGQVSGQLGNVGFVIGVVVECVEVVGICGEDLWFWWGSC